MIAAAKQLGLPNPWRSSDQGKVHTGRLGRKKKRTAGLDFAGTLPFASRAAPHLNCARDLHVRPRLTSLGMQLARTLTKMSRSTLGSGAAWRKTTSPTLRRAPTGYAPRPMPVGPDLRGQAERTLLQQRLWVYGFRFQLLMGV